MRKVIWVVAFVLMCGCEPSPPATVLRDQLTGDGMKLSQQASGYRGALEGMRNFLECWSKEVDAHLGKRTAGPLKAPNLTSVDPRLPLSARHFYASKHPGVRSLYERTVSAERFADPTALRPFKDAYPDQFGNWQLAFGDIDEPDARYYRYDKSQPPMRGRYLPNMLVLGHEGGGAFYLLIQEEKTVDGENEIMFLHHSGLMVRFKSFAHLLVHLYLEEHERMAGRDPAQGHIYFFPGNMGETCAKFIIDI